MKTKKGNFLSTTESKYQRLFDRLAAIEAKVEYISVLYRITNS